MKEVEVEGVLLRRFRLPATFAILVLEFFVRVPVAKAEVAGQEHTVHVRLDEGSTSKDLMMEFLGEIRAGKRC